MNFDTSPPENQKTIKFGIMCSGTNFQQWQANAILSLLEHDRLECQLIIFHKKGQFKRKEKFKHFLWSQYFALAKNRSRAVQTVDLSSKFMDTPSLNCQIQKKGKFSEYFYDSDISEIEDRNLDFILKFSRGIIRGKILDTAKYGIWSFHHDDEMKYRGRPACFWEIYNQDCITGAILQRITDKLDGGTVLKKGFFKTDDSYVKNRDRVYLESAKWPKKVCVDILNNHADYFDREASSTKAPIYYLPTNAQFLNFLFQQNLKKLQDSVRRLTLVNRASFGVARTRIQSLPEKDEQPSIEWFSTPPQGRSYFHPSALADGNQLHIFLECYSEGDRKGTIAYTCYEDGRFSELKIIINEEFSVSSPYILKVDSEIYMVFENRTENKLLLYKSTNFPLQWEIEKVAIENFTGTGNTLLHDRGIWWMFSSDRNDGETYNLNLFYADDLFGTWQPHPQNPVKTDVRSAKPAGTPFISNGELYRPAVNFAQTELGRITINQVRTMTQEKYHEVECAEVLPDRIYHLWEAGDYTIIAGCQETFRAT